MENISPPSSFFSYKECYVAHMTKERDKKICRDIIDILVNNPNTFTTKKIYTQMDTHSTRIAKFMPLFLATGYIEVSKASTLKRPYPFDNKSRMYHRKMFYKNNCFGGDKDEIFKEIKRFADKLHRKKALPV
jgi:hypothetical protein